MQANQNRCSPSPSIEPCLNLAGRAIVDAWWQARQALRPQRETLSFIARSLFQKRKTSRRSTSMHPTWTKNGPIGPMKSWNTAFETLPYRSIFFMRFKRFVARKRLLRLRKYRLKQLPMGVRRNCSQSCYSLGRPKERGRSIDRKRGSKGRPNHWRLRSRC